MYVPTIEFQTLTAAAVQSGWGVEKFPGTAADCLVLLVEGSGKTQPAPLRK
jgi:hypothetical protein